MSSEYRKGTVYIQGIPAGIITETDEGYSFKYDENYLLRDSVPAASLTLPLREEESRQKGFSSVRCVRHAAGQYSFACRP